jgi:hypothetical protein
VDWIKVCQEFGLIGGILLIVMFAIVTMSIKGWMWILEQFKHELNGNRSERVQYLDILHKIGAGVDEHNVRSKEFSLSVTADHKEMVKILGEQTLAIGRINGYIKDK